MAIISTVPELIDFEHYGGDTLTITVTAPSALVDALDWAAEIRRTRDAVTVDAVFTITPPSVADGPAYLVLPSDEVERLATLGPPVLRRVPTSRGVRDVVQLYAGVFDCQVSAAGADPVTTLFQGTLTLFADVTRPA